MVTYCLDTNIVIDMFRGDSEITDKINEIADKEADIFITCITLCELYKWAFLHSKKEKKSEEVDKFASSSKVLDFNIEACRLFGKNYRHLSDAGKLIPESDLMIASIVKMNNMTLITRDKKHFSNLNIEVEEW